MTTLIKILNIEDDSVLFECPNSRAHEAYEYAAKLEKMGIEFKFVKPGLPETFLNELNFSKEQKEDYFESLEEEINDHDDSCCHE